MDLETFKKELRDRPLPVVIDVWAPWCAPCRAIEPSLKKLSQEYAGRVDLIKINADEEPQLARLLGIYGVPTTLAFRGDQEVMRSTGAQPLNSLARLFDAALTGEKPAAPAGIPARERLLRVIVGLGIILLTGYLGQSFFGYAAGGVVLFTAFYDRCPVWQALAPRLSQALAALVGKGGSSSKAGS